MIAAESARALSELADVSAAHLRQEELLLEEILPMLREMQAGFGRPNAHSRTDERAEQVAQLIEMMTSKRDRLRGDLAALLGVDRRQVTLTMALAKLPTARKAQLEAAAARVKTMIEEVVKLTYWVSLHLRIHLDAFHRLICDLTNTGAGSGRYGPKGTADAPAYRPLFQVRG